MSFLEIKASNVFGLDVTLPCFVKLLVCLMLFLSLWDRDGKSVWVSHL